jgi:site-specific recombinase XerD
MRVHDVDFRANLVNIRLAFSHTTLSTPKCGEERPVPMADALRPILEQAAAGKRPTDRLVTSAQGETPSRQRLYATFIALQKRLGIAPTWSFHALRHAFGTHAIDGGAHIEAVRELMGHADLSATSRYVHATARDKRAVVALLGKERETAE